ncbi:MAG: 3-sulfinopropanoyl-CoA desulfinase [Pseudomonadota bacterium]
MKRTPSTDFYRATARDLSTTFADRAATWDRERRYCWDNIADLRAAGLLGMTLPRELGGQDATFLDVLTVVDEIGAACALTARVVVEANMGGISAVMAYGTEAQKTFCAPIVLAGDKPAICITEPDAGSAATEMTTTARRVPGGYRVNGRKHWITGGGVSKLHLVFARIQDGDGEFEGIGGLIVHRDPDAGIEPEGFEIVRHEHTLGLCGMPEAEMTFRDMFVSEENLLRPPQGLKRGFAALMTAYNSQRVGAGGVALGIASGALRHAKRYLLEREQFGRPIAEFQGLQWMLSDMDMQVHASRLMLQDAARSLGPDGKFPDQMTAARAKIFATEAAIKVVNDALQMFGARGYGDQEPLERMYRDVRMFTIGGGTAQVLRTQVASHLLDMKLPQTRGGMTRGGMMRDGFART